MKKTLKSFVARWWKSLTPDLIQDLVKNDLCLRNSFATSGQSDGDRSHLIALSRDLCSIIVFLIGNIGSEPQSGTSENKAWDIILRCIKENLHCWGWAKDPNLNHLLYLLCVPSARSGEIKSVGEDLLLLATAGDDLRRSAERTQILAVLECFYRFLRGKQRLRLILNRSFFLSR
jgi:hypothetical protein